MSIFAQVLYVMGMVLVIASIIYFVSKVHKGVGKREGAQERMRAKLIAMILVMVAAALQAIAYYLQLST